MNQNDILQKAYDPEQFRQLGHELIDRLADQLSKSVSGSSPTTTDYCEPETGLLRMQNLDQSNFFDAVFENTIRLHDPRFMGHQIMPPAGISALAGLVSDFFNNGMGVYEMGVAGTALDRIIVKEFGQRLGLGDDCDGILTCGGSLANLTAMLAARSHCSPNQDWKEGTHQSLALMVSDQSHYCVDRAARIMGWGEQGIIKIPCNDRFQMNTDLLESEYAKAIANGIRPIAVVGSACSTSTGSFDNLRAIGEFCENKSIWFHVDGAHGAANGLSQKYKSLLDGIELADSVTLDFHKMLMTPAIASALIFRDGSKSFGSFTQKADYLWQNSDSAEWFNMARRTFECTKTMLSVKVYSLIAYHGWKLFDANVTRLNDLAKEFANLIEDANDFELAVQPQTNIVCYRYLGDGPEDNINELNNQIRDAILRDGRFYIVQTSINGKTYLRSTMSNPLTQNSHITGLMSLIRDLAAQLMVA